MAFMSIEIVSLSHCNKELLNNIAPEVFDYEINSQYLADFLDDPRHIMYLAVDERVVVGMASAVEYFHPDKPPQLWINEIGVTISHRRRGIGRQLVQALVLYAHERGCAYAWLGTDIDNVAAQACFSSVPDVEKPQSFLLYEWELD
ncbi:MAG: GNAT family N-acetyltransferase [Leptolyngbya sp. SIO3F4]|nr:GNAT family N-acetyltransferase [Leptolyngbya sp. SIO3F4]